MLHYYSTGLFPSGEVIREVVAERHSRGVLDGREPRRKRAGAFVFPAELRWAHLLSLYHLYRIIHPNPPGAYGVTRLI